MNYFVVGETNVSAGVDTRVISGVSIGESNFLLHFALTGYAVDFTFVTPRTKYFAASC